MSEVTLGNNTRDQNIIVAKIKELQGETPNTTEEEATVEYFSSMITISTSKYTQEINKHLQKIEQLKNDIARLTAVKEEKSQGWKNKFTIATKQLENKKQGNTLQINTLQEQLSALRQARLHYKRKAWVANGNEGNYPLEREKVVLAGEDIRSYKQEQEQRKQQVEEQQAKEEEAKKSKHQAKIDYHNKCQEHYMQGTSFPDDFDQDFFFEYCCD
jgi:chromosome segregation ATPase